MDWCGKFEEGRKVAEEAVAEAKAFFKVPHPIMALCYTAYGYHIKVGMRCMLGGTTWLLCPRGQAVVARGQSGSGQWQTCE